jgi:hypothetical protein
MKEEFLHYLWKYGLYNKDSLKDKDGNSITVINPGLYNHDSGPDFFNARILICGTVWAGNIEIHTLSSHFEMHGHNNDPAYNNVILHVVAKDDRSVYNSRGEEVLTSEIKYDPGLYERYEALVNNSKAIACQDEVMTAGNILINQWLDRLAVERLEQKSASIIRMLDETGNDWEEVFYRILCRYFGFRVNTEPFEMLSNCLPFKIIRKHSDSIFQTEALLFGAAGMLDQGLFREAINDDYYKNLLREYKILSAKYSINSLHGWLWKFSRLRPANFPTLRISQLARMLTTSGGLCRRVLEVDRPEPLRSIFDVEASEYWNSHFIFGKISRESVKRTGSQATDILIINAVVPVVFLYGRYKDRQDICDRSILFLQETEAESNVIIREWEAAGIEAGSAFRSQALLQLRTEYCRKRRCLDCRIGNKLISMGKELKADEDLMLEPA